MSLGQPLLDAEHLQTKEKASMPDDKTDYLAGRIYANNAPRIFLETITARTASLVIALTYVVFIICFSVDLYTTYKSFTSSNYNIPAYTCGSSAAPVNAHGPRAGSNYDGCSSGNRWNSTVIDLDNVISIELSVQQINVTSLLSGANSSFSIAYNVTLWACYDTDGCGQNFDYTEEYTTDGSVWQRVLDSSETADVDLARDLTAASDGTLEVQLIQNTFQNQESIPTNGLVKAYYIVVYYLSAPYDLFTGEDSSTQQYITYEFDVVDRPRQPIADGFTLVLLVLTIAMLVWYVRVLSAQQTVLSEQKWIVGYFVLVILFQNPVYCTITWYSEPPSAGAAFTSYMLSFLGQSGLFMLWLFFADPVHRKTQSKLFFYAPKLLIGLSIFTASVVVLTFQFPGLDPTHPQRNAVEAVQNWSDSLKLSFIAFTMLYLLLIWLWTIVWFVQLYRTGRKLKKLPYMSTRYMQLSYRFFVVQATLVTVYYVLQYAAVVYFISLGAHNGDNAYDLTNLTDNINTLFRQQTQLFGKALFLTVYAMALALFYLPADVLDKTGLATSLAATYTITEAEHRSVVVARKKALAKVKRSLLTQITLMDALVDAKTDVFCVDLALSMRDMAFQAYYDPPDLRTASGYEASLDLSPHGYELLDKFYSADYELFCFIARERSTKRIVVCFRGTASKKQMEANLKYSQRAVNFDELDLPALDQLDGLAVRTPKGVEAEDLDMDSVSDDDGEQDNDSVSMSMSMEAEGSGAGSGARRTLSLRRDKDHRDNAKERERDSTMMDRAGHVREELQKAFTGAVGATNQGIHAVVDATADLMVTAASSTPMLKSIVLPYVHSGFWEAYSVVRGFLHGKLRQELMRNPTTVVFTGHSLGGALATYAALDISMHTIPRVNAYLKHHAKLLYLREREAAALLVNRARSESLTAKHGSPVKTNPMHSAADDEQHSDLEHSHMTSSEEVPPVPVFVKKIKVVMYNFGSPRVGNRSFVQLYNRFVPSSFRVVVDGDIVAGLPPSKYAHVGTEIMIDALGAGSIIIDPSFVERWLRTHLKSSVAVHSLLVYRRGLLGLKLSAEYLKLQYDPSKHDSADPLRLAIMMRNKHKIAESDFGAVLRIQEEAGNVLQAPAPRPADIEAGPVSISAEGVPGMMINLQDLRQQAADPVPVGEAESKEDTPQGALYARHYAHDVENMTALMSQIRTLKSTAGPVNWMKRNTVDRIKVKKFNRPRSPKPDDDNSDNV